MPQSGSTHSKELTKLATRGRETKMTIATQSIRVIENPAKARRPEVAIR